MIDTARLTITRHPGGEQCDDLLADHLIDIDAVNTTGVPGWILAAAERSMCSHPDHRARHNLPRITEALEAMNRNGITQVIATAQDKARLEEGVYCDGRSRIAELLDALPGDRPHGQTRAVIGLTSGHIAVMDRAESWAGR